MTNKIKPFIKATTPKLGVLEMNKPITKKEMRAYIDATWERCHTQAWSPRLEQIFENAVLVSQTMQYTPQGKKQAFPARPWVGLTADEIVTIGVATGLELAAIHMIEAKLKEKNALPEM